MSKLTSHKLSKERGPCIGMAEQNSKYLKPGFLSSQLGNGSLRSVTQQEIDELEREIIETKQMRNAGGTVGLPPTGITSILLDTSPSIEPLFSVYSHSGLQEVNPAIVEYLTQRGYEGKELESILDKGKSEATFQNIKELSEHERLMLKIGTE